MALPTRGASYTFYVRLVSAADNTQLVAPTLATGDVTVSQDDAAPANIASLPTVVNGKLKVVLSAAEMNSANATYVKFEDQTVPADWLPLDVTIPTI